MNEKYSRGPRRSAPKRRSDLTPRPAALFRAVQETELDSLKQRLLLRLLSETPEPAFNASIRQAANDAAALAWTTSHPLLVFPVLLEEKAATARRQTLRQERIRDHSRDLMLEL